ncbi:MAG: hypothetical protein COA74_05725 [Gammaproteobacteria bacterium]|nr:MAG: hypothetical protein COA74_05725 [Gammaproteobacteria bacterium]
MIIITIIIVITEVLIATAIGIQDMDIIITIIDTVAVIIPISGMATITTNHILIGDGIKEIK